MNTNSTKTLSKSAKRRLRRNKAVNEAAQAIIPAQMSAAVPSAATFTQKPRVRSPKAATFTQVPKAASIDTSYWDALNNPKAKAVKLPDNTITASTMLCPVFNKKLAMPAGVLGGILWLPKMDSAYLIEQANSDAELMVTTRIPMSIDLADDYSRVRVCQGVIGLKGNALAVGATILQGSLDGVLASQLPAIAAIDTSKLSNYAMLEDGCVGQSTVAEGMEIRYLPSGKTDFHVPYNNTVKEGPVTVLKYSAAELVAELPFSLNKADLPPLAVGPARFHLEWQTANPIGYTNAFFISIFRGKDHYEYSKNFIQGESHFDWTIEDSHDGDLRFVSVTWGMGAFPEGNLGELTMELWNADTESTSPAALMLWSGLTETQSIILDGRVNYEAVPDYGCADKVKCDFQRPGEEAAAYASTMLQEKGFQAITSHTGIGVPAAGSFLKSVGQGLNKGLEVAQAVGDLANMFRAYQQM